ncbi:MAG: MFS transporter [Methanoregula sp.]|nr:MFS transporter [Methanoregula sp.]
MKAPFTLFFGIFVVMALSNAIVPVLPSYTGSSSLQGAIYAAYFLGAFLSTLPAGMLSDRFGRVPLIRSGLVITAASGFLLSMNFAPYPVLAARFIEGIGGGCFVAATMSYVNSRTDHEKMSGYYMALLNAGLVTGLVLAGWLASYSGEPAAGILLFTGLALVCACISFFMQDAGHRTAPFRPGVFVSFVRDYRWLWFSSVVLIGITGVVSSLYPQFSGASSDSLGYWIAGMSIVTIGAVLAASRASLPPVPAIRWSAVLMAAGVMVAFFSPWGFAILGALAGIVMIAQMAILAGVREHQGVVMGLFSTTSYLGMTILPFIAGLCADIAGFFWAFSITAFFAIMVALTIGQSMVPEKAQ